MLIEKVGLITIIRSDVMVDTYIENNTIIMLYLVPTSNIRYLHKAKYETKEVEYLVDMIYSNRAYLKQGAIIWKKVL